MSNNEKLPSVFLHEHEGLQTRLKLDKAHVIVDREDWHKALERIKSLENHVKDLNLQIIDLLNIKS